MRLVYKRYVDGRYKLYRTDEHGRNEEVIDTDVPEGHTVRRVPVFIELSCDDDRLAEARDGLNRLTDTLNRAQ